MGEHARRRTAIDTALPEEVRKEINRLLLEGETYDGVTEWLKEKGYDISRSSVGRYGKEFFQIVRNVRIVEEKAATLLSDAEQGMILEEATTKLLLNKLMELLMTNKIDMAKSTKVLTDLANLQKSVVSREKLKIEIKEKTKAAAAKIENITKKAGLSQETINRIKKEVLGIGQ